MYFILQSTSRQSLNSGGRFRRQLRGVESLLFASGSSRKQSPAEAWGDGVVYLYENNRCDAVVGVVKAERGAGGVEGLRDHDAADDCGMNIRRRILGKKPRASGVAPTPEQGKAEQEDIEPVNQERDAEVDVFREQCGRKRCQRDGAEECNVNPREVAVGACELIELRLLADPEDAVGHHAHQEDKNARGEHNQDAPEIALGVNGFPGGDVKVKHKQGHGHRKDAIAEGGEALYALS